MTVSNAFKNFEVVAEVFYRTAKIRDKNLLTVT